MILFEKYGQHQPLDRQSERHAQEGIDLDVSTIGLCPIPRSDVGRADRADRVGAAAAAPAPLHALIAQHVLAAERLRGDGTTVPVLAKGKTITGRLWAYVRDDRPFAGPDPPAAPFHHARDRRGVHPEAHLASYGGILRADACSGSGGLYAATREGGAVTEALCWSHARRHFFELADLARPGRAPPAPLALEAVRRIDAIFAHAREINGRSAELRLAGRREHAALLVAAFATWMRSERPRLSRHAPVARAMDCMLERWPACTRLLDDGRIRPSSNAAERSLRGVALGRKAWLFCGSDRGGERAAVMYGLIGTAKLDDVDPQAWLADGLERIADQPLRRLHELLPWNWQPTTAAPVCARPADHSRAAN